MKKGRIINGLFMIIFLMSFLINAFAFAIDLKGTTGGSLNALDSGYAITRWPWSGGDIYPGDSATVRAYTTEYPTATHVVFRWISPFGNSFDTPSYPLLETEDTWGTESLRYAEDTQTLFDLGDWGVQALFIDEEGKLQGPNPYPIVKIRAISGHVVPEIPLGSLATIIAMIGALSIFYFTKYR